MDKTLQYMTWMEQVITSILAREDVAGYRVGGWEGPHTLSLSFKLYDPTVARMTKVMKLSPMLEHALDTSPVRITYTDGRVFFEVPTLAPTVIVADALHGKKLAVPIGVSSLQNIVGIDFKDSPHLLCVGPTRVGKTTAMRTIAYQLCKQNRPATTSLFIFCAPSKVEDWGRIATLPNALAMVTNPDETYRALKYLQTLADGSNPWQLGKHTFIFVDDLMALLQTSDIADTLASIASIGASSGVHLIIGTQTLGKNGAGASIERNITTRLVFGTASGQDAALFTGRSGSGAERIGRFKGDALLIENDKVTRVAIALTPASALDQLPLSTKEFRPWLDGKEEDPEETPVEVTSVEPMGTNSTGATRWVTDQDIRREYMRCGTIQGTVLALWPSTNSAKRMRVKKVMGLV